MLESLRAATSADVTGIATVTGAPRRESGSTGTNAAVNVAATETAIATVTEEIAGRVVAGGTNRARRRWRPLLRDRKRRPVSIRIHHLRPLEP